MKIQWNDVGGKMTTVEKTCALFAMIDQAIIQKLQKSCPKKGKKKFSGATYPRNR